MKDFLRLTIMLLSLQPVASFAAGSIADQAAQLERRMDSVKPLFRNSTIAPDLDISPELAEQQGQIADDVSALIGRASRSRLDQRTLEALVHLIARVYLYDGKGQTFEDNVAFFKGNSARIHAILNQMQNQRTPFEKGEPFDEERVEKIRFQIGLATGTIRSTSSSEKARPLKSK